MPTNFELLLFSVDNTFIQRAIEAGVSGIIIDWECHGKKARQSGFNTEINHYTVDDLVRVRRCTEATIICRINQYGPTTHREIEQAAGAGADEILLPMVRSSIEVERVLEIVRERCEVGILVETVAALSCLDELSKLPLRRVYVGLNDLAIDRKTSSIFAPIADGLLDEIRSEFDLPFGFGGLTLPDCGHPIPCRMLIQELTRLKCRFSFLRRSFHADIVGRRLDEEIPRLHAALQAASRRPREEIACDHAALCAAIQSASLDIAALRVSAVATGSQKRLESLTQTRGNGSKQTVHRSGQSQST